MILQFPSPREPTPAVMRRTCFRCVNARFDGDVTRCTVFEETIDSELYAARDCPSYDEGE